MAKKEEKTFAPHGDNKIFVVGAILILGIVFSLLLTDSEFVGKAILSVQGYGVADVPNEKLPAFQECLTTANKQYPSPIYGHQDRYCSCVVKGVEGCDVYLSKNGICKSAYLPDKQHCGADWNVNMRGKVYNYWQFPDCNTQLFKLYNCDDLCDASIGTCVENVCNENDGGFNVFEYSEINGITSRTDKEVAKDECISGTMLNEYYCKNGLVESKMTPCEYGCVLGACKTMACIDSDGGRDIYVYGTADGGIQGNVHKTMSDSCADTKTLQEAFCAESGTVGYADFECEKGCSEGRCVE